MKTDTRMRLHTQTVRKNDKTNATYIARPMTNTCPYITYE